MGAICTGPRRAVTTRARARILTLDPRHTEGPNADNPDTSCSTISFPSRSTSIDPRNPAALLDRPRKPPRGNTVRPCTSGYAAGGRPPPEISFSNGWKGSPAWDPNTTECSSPISPARSTAPTSTVGPETALCGGQPDGDCYVEFFATEAAIRPVYPPAKYASRKRQ